MEVGKVDLFYCKNQYRRSILRDIFYSTAITFFFFFHTRKTHRFVYNARRAARRMSRVCEAYKSEGEKWLSWLTFR